MSARIIPPHPVIDEERRKSLAMSVLWTVSCEGGPPPGARMLQPGVFSLGHDSDWSPDTHPLTLSFEIPSIMPLRTLFGRDGVASQTARLGLGLDWSSAGTARRGSKKLRSLRLSDLDDLEDERLFGAVEIPGEIGGMRAAVEFSLGCYLEDAGEPDEAEEHLARLPGFRFGPIGDPIEYRFDGKGSLFPIMELDGEPSDPLWSYQDSWDDPGRDEFVADLVALSINRRHPGYAELKGTDKRSFETALFRQVVASWTMLLLSKLKADPLWTHIESGKRTEFERGSIADAAWYFLTRGDIDASSPESMMDSCQRWIDRQFVAAQIGERR